MKAMFFDMDGTIIDSRADLAATVNHTRRDYGLPELSMEEIISHVGRGARKLLSETIPEHDGEESLKLFLSHYGDHLLQSCVLYPGVESTLEELRRRGWRLGVNTAKPAFAVKIILEHFGLASFFGSAVIAGGDCDEMKPSAKPLLACAAKMEGHVLSANDWMIGDNWTDMQCAVNAGVNGAFCDFGFGVLRDSYCARHLANFSDLLQI